MSEKERKLISENCMKRCRFKTKNCSMNEDGTWDCSTKLENCFGQCQID
jgi:hypothetical protein